MFTFHVCFLCTHQYTCLSGIFISLIYVQTPLCTDNFQGIIMFHLAQCLPCQQETNFIPTQWLLIVKTFIQYIKTLSCEGV